MKAEDYYRVMADDVFPAIRAAMPWATHIRVQADNARAHTGKGVIERLNEEGALRSPRISIIQQPARSPDCNILDLCIFRSWAARNHKLQKFCRANDLEALWANTQEAWAGCPVEVVKRSWVNKSLILQEIKKANGGNFFNVPHVSEELRSQVIHWH